MGNNPDIYLSADGQIQIVSTQFKGKSFITDLNIEDFLPWREKYELTGGGWDVLRN